MRRSILFLSALVTVFSCGCALYTDQESLQKRVTDLETQVKKLEAEKAATALEDSNRQQKLEGCVTVDADQVYWSYMKLNGTKKGDGS
jgi:cell division protein FtsB